MKFYAQMNSPLGTILLSSNGSHLDGLYFDDQKDCPAIDSTAPMKQAKADPTAGMMAGAAIKNFKAYKKSTEPDLFDGLDPSCSDASGQDARLAWDTDLKLLTLQDATPRSASDLFEQTRDELKEYFDGKRHVFTVPIHLDGTDFQKKVWQALLTIPYGEYVSYGDVALTDGLTAGLTAQHGRPVGTAVGRNPLTIIVPCHRVLAGTGRLNGYTGGLERKFALLKLEGFAMA